MKDTILIRRGKNGLQLFIGDADSQTVWELTDGCAFSMRNQLNEYMDWKFYDAVTKKDEAGGGFGRFS